MFESREAALASPTGDVDLVQSLESGLVYNRAFRPELVKYDGNYQNEQGHSAAFQHHLDEVEVIVAKHFHSRRLVEVGCGKGHFLERLTRAGFDVIGMDPTYEGCSSRVIKAFFTPNSGIQADAIVLRHVLEHVQDPFTFLLNLRAANGGGGLIYIEVPCFDWIVGHHAWFDIFYEHVNYFRLVDFEKMFYGIVAAGHLFAGQYLYIVADLGTLRPPSGETPALALPESFTTGIVASATHIRRSMARGGRSYVWGGASKGVIFSVLVQRSGAHIDGVIDINPAKQGRFLPGTGLEVEAPHDVLPRLPDGTDIFVMNPNYLGEIKLAAGTRFNLRLVDES